MTVEELAEALKKWLSPIWTIHVDEVVSRQIPADSEYGIRRAKTVKHFAIIIYTYKPLYMYLYLSAKTLPELITKIKNGELEKKIQEEFAKNQIKYEAQPGFEGIEQQQRIECKRLAITK